MDVRSAFVFCIIIAGLVQHIHCIPDVNKDVIGVAYGPYTKQWVGNQIPQWNTYTAAQVQCQLQFIATKFRSLSTYTLGTNDSVTSLVPSIAAKINKERESLALTIAQGIHQIKDVQLQYQELSQAVIAASEANKIYPGTVWAITYNWEDIQSIPEAEKIIQMIALTRDATLAKGLKLGARTQNCEAVFYPTKFPEIIAMLKRLVEQSDYIMCNFYPDYISSQKSVEDAVAYVARVYEEFTKLAKSVNPNIEVIIGEIGWPSEGVAFNGSPSTVDNMIKFWLLVGKLAADAQVRVQFFEAIDEPWKSDRNNRDPNSAEGFNGGEGHYGLWYQPNNSQPCNFVEKGTETKG